MRRRQGFTLVELLVSMALIIFIMAILSQAFGAAMTTFRNLKAAGDMAEKLRATTQLLQRDLAADHFEGKKRLSDPSFWVNGPPLQGFFQILQGSASTSEGADPSNINSYVSTSHSLAFTVRLRGNDMGDFFTAGSQGTGSVVMGGTPPRAIGTTIGVASISFGPLESRYQSSGGYFQYNYPWAEVAWFLLPSTNPNTNAQDTTVQDPVTGATAMNLYTLYRRQRLLVPDNNLVPTQSYANQGQYNTLMSTFQEMSCWGNPVVNPPGSTPGALYFNSPIDITVPWRRFGSGVGAYSAIPQGSNGLTGSDIQLNDVVSFDVRMQVLGVTPNAASPDSFGTLFDAPFAGYTYTNPGVTGMVFDTWSSLNDSLSNYSQSNQPGTAGVSIPLWNAGTNSGPIIQAIQISIRIWDFKTNQTRQVTLVQAM